MKEEALKLADELLRDNTQLTVESAYMIRRLVEELDKQEKSDANLHLTSLTEVDRSPLDSNESISQHKAIMRKNAFNEYIPLFLGNDGLPEGTLLYATPQTKPLSDEEILDMSDSYIENQFELAFTGEGLVEYVRAVMKKASGQ